MTTATSQTAATITPPAPPATSSRSARRLLATTVVAAPTLIAINSLFHPEVDVSGAGFLAGAQTGPSVWFAVHIIAGIGAMLGLAAAFGLHGLVRGRGRRLATTGLGLTLLAAPLLAMSFAIEASLLRLAAAELDPTAALTLAEAYAATPEFYAIGIAVMLGTLGSLLLGLGLLASRSVPRAAAATYLLATIAATAGVPGTPVGPIAFVLIAGVSVVFARRILRPGPAPADLPLDPA